MNLIKTKSFELTANINGDKNAKRLAILIPGRLDTKDYANFISHAKYLAGKGFLVLTFDPPGTWNNPGDISLYTTTNYLRAVNELMEYFGNKPTLLVGHSRGGTAAILASNNEAVIGIILIMASYGPPSDPKPEAVKQGFNIEYRDLPPGKHKTDVQKEFKLPLLYWTDGKKYNPAQALKECIKPKLLIYGTRDEWTSTQTVKEVYESILKPKMIKEIDSEHDYRRNPETIKEIEETIGKFLETYIK